MPLLQVRNLTKRFGGLMAVNNVSFDVEEGTFLSIIGPNGAGKTTLFNLICGYLKLEEGKVIFKGKDITNKPPYVVSRMGIGRTFQISKPLLRLSVLDNVAISAFNYAKSVNESRERVTDILKLLGLYEMRFRKAMELNVIERKKLELARALALKPELLLLDEQFHGLNPKEVNEMLDTLKTIHQTMVRTIILIEHVMQAVMSIAQRVIVLHNGMVIADGVPKEIANNEKVIEVYLGKSFKGEGRYA